jgi:Acetyltransferase (GNAT) family
MALTAAPESFTACIPELKEIIGQHYEKLALNKDKVPLAPQWEIYIEREQMGEVSFTVLRDRGKMVGYAIFFISPGLHYKTCLTAIMDIWNVLPEYEGPKALLTLWNAVEKELKRRGVNRAFVGEKLHKPCGKLYKWMGYEPVEQTYTKWIQG